MTNFLVVGSFQIPAHVSVKLSVSTKMCEFLQDMNLKV